MCVGGPSSQRHWDSDSTELFVTLFMEGENVKHRVYVMHIVAVNMAVLLFETDVQ